ncbi:MAG: hypothetical protein COX54_02690 [Candidatus Yonathbacteria bacterium CG23_combo_of_CG06-09_8_20_14_all_46_18]|nr:MAG: hypothetical protein COX54_02690 [Candidatus Yonathbacteria bacterium CG23_combo_of_CG06-09_8_20_14_all_46_18]
MRRLENIVWCRILELVRTHFSEKIPPRKFGKAAPTRLSLGAGGGAAPLTISSFSLAANSDKY